ncbi:M23 family metallopeptidase [Arthrobacter sp. NPDC058130]|uniref:M23 family metallopeptidase n=1 Tax=Arthrobacter sp. NPDC058130 TaxID=3346353 RepID=UPI0036EF2F97
MNASGRRRIVAFVAAAIGVALAVVLLLVSSGSDTLHRPDAKHSPEPNSLEAPSAAADEFSPITASTLGSPSTAVPGTDEQWHLVYELHLTNVRPQPSTVESIDVLDAANEGRIVETFSGADLQRRLRTLGSRPTTSLALEPNGARLVLIELDFDGPEDVPNALVHRFHVLTAPVDGGSAYAQTAYMAAPLPLDGGATVVGPPLTGAGWVAGNGCCATDGVHRATVLPINGALHAAQRFAIDWIRLDSQGRLVNGDPADVRSYTAYGADIVAVAGGTVVGALDTLDDQIPGQLPDPGTITLENVLGNHVTVRHGDGRYATYAHMQKGSVAVGVGSSVLPGQTLGRIGNTGNTSAPHLHFQITEGRSVLGSDGLPFVVDRFRLQGRMNAQRWAAATTLEGTWNEGLLPSPSPRSAEIPLDVDIVDFGDRR